MPLRKADTNTTRRFEDGEDWMELRTGGLTKGEADRVRDLTAAFRVDPRALAGVADADQAMVELNQRVAQANKLLFALLCTGWSLGEVSAEAYEALDQQSGEWVDECIATVLAERRARAEKNPPSSKRPSRRAGSSAKAAS